MSNALAVINNFDDLKKTGEMMARSGLFKDSTDVFKAMVQIQAGQELGVSPFQSMSGIHIIKGKPVLSSGLLASLIKRHPDYDYRVISHSSSECVIEFYENSEIIGESSFSLEDAKRAGLLSNTTWAKYPKNMVFSRALSNGAKWYCAGIFGGSVYVEGEIIDNTHTRVVPSHNNVKRMEAIEGEVVEDEPQDTQRAWWDSLNPHQQKAGLGKWGEAVNGIARYDDIHGFNGACKKLIDGGTNNYLLIEQAGASNADRQELFRRRVAIYDAVFLYAECRDNGKDEYEAQMAVHENAEAIMEGLGEILKPISISNVEDIPSASGEN